ncbi:protein kinase [Nonomuraea sp. B12E4]|uniref:serine/threonine protein kinase n=1 Tax=Nonomuraea sp. B12E4 TaxID=3153564 RepID=UPI00325E4AE4
MPTVEPLREGDPAAAGPYRLVGRLGAGGHGVVYLGQARNGAPIAVKVLHEGITLSERLVKAIAGARRVEPFCLARVLDASTSGRAYIVAEYVDGPSLQQAGPRGGTDLRRLAVATATALDAIHQAGVVHGDFKPANVLLGADGPRVVDFGIAAALGSGVKATGAIVGTPAYMAPEQLAGRAVGAPADVFAWASVVVFAATGVPPFGDDSLPVVINRILHEEPEIGELGSPLREVVLACLAKSPATRPAMRDVLLRLTAPLRHRSAAGPEPAIMPRPETPPPNWHQLPDLTPDHTAHRPQPSGGPLPWAKRPDGPALRPQPANQPASGQETQEQPPVWPEVPATQDATRQQPPDQPAASHETQDRQRPARQFETAPMEALFNLASPAESPEHPEPVARFEPERPEPARRFEAATPGGSPVAVMTAPSVPAEAAEDEAGSRPPRPRPWRRRLKTALVITVAGVTVLALAGAIVWLTPTTPTPKTRSVAAKTDAPATSTASPDPGRTTVPTPRTDDATGAVPTATATAATGRLRLISLRANGTRNGACWADGELTLQALVQRTGGPLTFTYVWIVDGAIARRATALIPENGRRYLTAPRSLTSTAGPHDVALRITSPIALQRSISVTTCESTTL